MKRSEINAILLESVRFIQEMRFCLPPFAYWRAEDWKQKGRQYDEIRENMLGWDITDFGEGDYTRVGLLMFTLRNGGACSPAGPKPYAEKLLISDEGQVTPYHYHYKKMEDIINRGGGNLIVKVYPRTGGNRLDESSPVLVSRDGCNERLPAGSAIRLKPGESITLYSGLYHSFWAEEGCGKVLIGEVSSVNDDRADNRFLEETGRFPKIEEDEPPLYLMSMDY